MDPTKKPMAMRNVLSRLLITTVRHTRSCLAVAALPLEALYRGVAQTQQQARAAPFYLVRLSCAKSNFLANKLLPLHAQVYICLVTLIAAMIPFFGR
jgi:hypothetical protein